MSEQENDLNTIKREEFKKYLNKLGVVEAITNVLAKLYELKERPTDPLDFIRTNMTEIVNEREELKKLKIQHENMVLKIKEMEDENMNLAKAINELEPYEEVTNSSKTELLTDEYNIGME